MATHISAQDFIRGATRTAHHFGFSHINTLKADPACKECTEKVQHKVSAQEKKIDSLYGILTSGMTTYFDNHINGIPGPSLFYTIEKVPRSGDIVFSFHVLNVSKSIAESLIIHATRSLLADLGYGKNQVRINSLGDADSLTRYTRDLTNYLRKRLDEMPPNARELMKQHPCEALMHLIEKNHEMSLKSPSPLEYLSDASRKHFREIVEYLDMSQTPFEIDPRLMGHHACYSDVLFAIDVLDENNLRYASDDEPITVRGGRYDAFVSRMTNTKVPAVGGVLILKNKKAPENIPVSRTKLSSDIYLAQLGFSPKVRTLLLIEELQHAGIMVSQNIMSDSLSEQLRQAETKNARFAVIMGHKEFMENTLIVRNLHERSQENIPMHSLASYLRKKSIV